MDYSLPANTGNGTQTNISRDHFEPALLSMGVFTSSVNQKAFPVAPTPYVSEVSGNQYQQDTLIFGGAGKSIQNRYAQSVDISAQPLTTGLHTISGNLDAQDNKCPSKAIATVIAPNMARGDDLSPSMEAIIPMAELVAKARKEPGHFLSVAGRVTLNLTSRLSPTLLFASKFSDSVYSPAGLAIPISLIGLGAQSKTAEHFQTLLLGENGVDAGHNFFRKAVCAMAGLSGVITQERHGTCKMLSAVLLSDRLEYMAESYRNDLLALIELLGEGDTAHNIFAKYRDISTEECKNLFNDKVAQTTDHKVKRSLERNIPADYHSVLANVLYINGSQLGAFSACTTAIQFKKLIGFDWTGKPLISRSKPISAILVKEVPCIDMLYLGNHWRVIWCDSGEGQAFMLFLVMPTEINTLLGSLKDADIIKNTLRSIKYNQKYEKRNVVFPELKLKSCWSMERVLTKAQVLEDMFDGNGDFGQLSNTDWPCSDFKVNSFYHEVVFDLCCSQGAEKVPADKIIMFDQPFKLFVLHKPSGAIMLEGSVLNADAGCMSFRK